MNAYVHLLIVYVIWGTVYPVIRLLLTGPEALSPLQLQGGRLFFAAVLLAVPLAAPLVLRRQIRSRSVFWLDLSWRDLRLCVVCGLLFWVAGNGFATFALGHLPAGFVTMAMSSIPLWTAALQLGIDRQSVGGRQITVLAIGLLGMAIVYVPALSRGPDSHLDRPAELAAAFLAPVTWALAAVLQPGGMKISVSAAASIQLATGGLACIALAIVDGTPLPRQMTFEQALSFGYLVVFVGVLCFSSYIRVARVFPAYVAGTFAYVNPVVSLLLAAVLLGERPSAISLCGVSIVILSVVVLLLQVKPRSEATRANVACTADR